MIQLFSNRCDMLIAVRISIMKSSVDPGSEIGTCFAPYSKKTVLCINFIVYMRAFMIHTDVQGEQEIRKNEK